jgi:hypothetical protein
MSNKKVLTGAERKAQLLDAGAKLAVKLGAQNVTRRDVAKACKLKSEALVSHYMGGTVEAQKAYAKHAKKLGLTLPTKAEADAIGVKLRAHGPRDKRDTRRRSVKEVKAIKQKVVRSAKSGKFVPAKEAYTNPDFTVRETVVRKSPGRSRQSPGLPLPSPAQPLPTPPERKTAARAPKAPPLPSS